MNRTLPRALLFLAPLFGVVGVTLNVPALSILAGGLVMLMLAAALYVMLVGGRLVIERRAPAGACQDDVVTTTLRVVNRGWLPVHLPEIGDEFGPALDPPQRLVAPGTMWPGYQHTFEYEGHCFRKRGVYMVGPLSVQVRDPLGFFWRKRSIADIQPFDVYPKIIPLEGVRLPGGRPGLSAESDSIPRPGRSLVYLGARDYVPGDEVRDIHWPATARWGRLIVKEREFDLPPMLTLVLDLDERHFEGVGQRSTIEFQVSVAASLAMAVTQRRGAFQVYADGLHVPTGSGPLQMEEFMHRLVSVRPQSKRAIGEVLYLALPHVPPDSLVVPFIAGRDVHPGLLSAAVQGCVASGSSVRAVVLDDATFLKRAKFATEVGRARLSLSTLTSWLSAAGARVCVMGADDDPSAKVMELFG